MERSDLSQRLGLSVPYEWWPSTPLLKEIEAAGFGWVQVPSPPSSVLVDPRACAKHANALREALATSGLRLMLHAPGSLRAGTPSSDRAIEGLVSYAAEAGAPLVVYHAANFPDALASEDALLAETRSLAAVSRRAERLGVTIALENLAPVFPGPDALSHTPRVLRTMAKRIDSPAIGVCLDVGHAHLVASLRRTDIAELIEPVLDRGRGLPSARQPGRASRRRGPPGARPGAPRPAPAARPGKRPLGSRRPAARASAGGAAAARGASAAARAVATASPARCGALAAQVPARA